MSTFSNRLKELRDEKGLSQRDLAKAVDLSQSAIAHWENRISSPNADAVILLAQYFNVSAGYLLGIED